MPLHQSTITLYHEEYCHDENVASVLQTCRALAAQADIFLNVDDIISDQKNGLDGLRREAWPLGRSDDRSDDRAYLFNSFGYYYLN